MTDILNELLDLRAQPNDRFIGECPPVLAASGRMFGGALLAMIVRAATLTVDSGQRPHVMHNFFVTASNSREPVTITVQRNYDGGSFSSRTITVTQDDNLRCSAMLSFNRTEVGLDVGVPIRAEAPAPESDFLRFKVLEGSPIATPFDLREVDVSHLKTGSPHDTTRMMWAKLKEPLDEELRPCLLAYISDFGATIGARAIVGATFQTPGRFASLNHSLWWHREVDPSDWLLIDFRPLTATGSRGLVSGAIHDQHGSYLATVAQEALMRLAEHSPQAS